MKQELINALEGIRNGADIYSRYLARQLREVQKKHPEYIHIGNPRKYNGDGTDVVPFFGAITTPAGNVYLDKVNVFNSFEAIKAQEEYCKNKHLPHFAPNDGICYRCKKDIYQRRGLQGYETGISLNEAKTTHIIYCPHCNLSYCD